MAQDKDDIQHLVELLEVTLLAQMRLHETMMKIMKQIRRKAEAEGGECEEA